MNDRAGYESKKQKETTKAALSIINPSTWRDIIARLLAGGWRDRAFVRSGHANGRRKPRDWREKKKRRAKIAKASQKINRQRSKK